MSEKGITKIALVWSATDAARAIAARIREAWPQVGGVITREREVDHGSDSLLLATGCDDAMFVVGGDGFLLEVLRRFDAMLISGLQMRYPTVPIVGWNAGKVGFLMDDVHQDRLTFVDQLRHITFGAYHEQQYQLLGVDAWGPGVDDFQPHKTSRAFNEVQLKPAGGQSVRLQLIVDGAYFGMFSGDGLIFATTQGSTAYTVAAGGAMVDPELTAIVVTPVNPARAKTFMQFSFPLVLRPDTKVRIKVHEAEKRPVILAIDGRGTSTVTDVHIGYRTGLDAESVCMLRFDNPQRRFLDRIRTTFF